jgi:hypothetical protein
VLFLLSYFGVMGVHPNAQHSDIRRLSISKTIVDYARSDLLACLFLAVFLSRFYLILGGRRAPSPLWDGVASGGVACYLAYFGLRNFTPW